MSYLVAVVLLAAAAASGLRWLRVVQREHYLGGSATRFALRWWTCDVANVVLIGVVVLSLLATFISAYAGVAVAIVLIVGPFGLPLKGSTSSLAWTDRLKRLTTLAGAIYLIIAVLCVVALGGNTGIALLGLLSALVPVVIDVACIAAQPLEDKKMQPFIDQAQRRLAAVSPRVVAITGSYGKTSTKNHLADLLSGSVAVVPTPRSFNNRAGLARAVNEQLVEGTQVFIAEMGTYGPGEIADLCSWCPPEIAVMTAIGPVHLERFGSLDVTLAAKTEITTNASVVVLNADDERLATLVTPLQAQGKRVIAVSAHRHDADVALIADGDHFSLTIDGELRGAVHIPEGVQPSNVACAIGAAMALGVDLAAIIPRIDALPAVQNRLTVAVAPSGVRIIDDTFNANPAGAAAALRVLNAQHVEGRRVVVTPGMIELGEKQREENERFGARCAEIADVVIVVRRTNRAALKRGVERIGGCELRLEDSREEAVAWIRKNLGPGDCVLYENDLPDNYP